MGQHDKTSQAEAGQIAAQLLAAREQQYEDEDRKEGEDGACGQHAVTKHGATYE